jgi:hypothetical protein
MQYLPIPEQGRYLRLVLNGFYNYHAAPTNSGARHRSRSSLSR